MTTFIIMSIESVLNLSGMIVPVEY